MFVRDRRFRKPDLLTLVTVVTGVGVALTVLLPLF